MKTALITGASSGIGYELAKVFAKNKINLVIVARRENKLKELSKELISTGVSIQVLPIDLSLPQSAGEVFNFCESCRIKIDYLVNNAGFGDYNLFAESELTKQEQMINVNITALTHLTHLFLPSMQARKYGRILNVASTAAFLPGPNMSVYFATKAFVLSFSEALSSEFEGSGITVTALCPGATESEFMKVSGMRNSQLIKGKKLPGSAEVAEYGYDALMNGKVVAIHGMNNSLMVSALRFLPRSLVRKIMSLLRKRTE